MATCSESRKKLKIFEIVSSSNLVLWFHLYLWASNVVDLVTKTVSRIRKFLANGPTNTMCYKKKEFQ